METKLPSFPNPIAPSAPLLRGPLRHSEPDDPGAGQRTLQDYWAIIRKRSSLVSSVFLFFVGIALIYCFLTPSLYTARAAIEIRGHAPVLANSQSEALFGSDTRKIEYQKTTVAKLNLEGVADQVLSTDGLALELDEYWSGRRSLFQRAYGAATGKSPTPYEPRLVASNDSHFIHSPSILRKYLSLVEIMPVHETNLVTISATTTRPELSQRVANTHALGFIAHLQRERRDAITTNISLLQRQANELKARVTAAEEALSKYATENRLLTVRQDEGTNIHAKQIESLSSMLAESIGRRIRSESILLEAQNKKTEESSIADDDITRQLRVTLKQAESEYATQASRLMGPHPAMLELKAKVDSLKKAIGEERKRSLKNIQGQFDADRAAEQRLRNQIESERAAAQEVAQRLISYNVLSKEASSLRDLYQTVLKQVKEVEISAATATSNVYVADYASLPGKPSAPQTGVILILFAIIGLTSGVLAALIADALEDRLSTTEQVQAALALPMLGVIPAFEPLPSPPEMPALGAPEADDALSGGDPTPTQPPAPDGRAKRLMTVSSPREPVSEALRTLRASILLSSADHPPRIVMVSSALQGEGKTTIASNLAGVLTQGTYRVVLIDADLRLAGLSKLFFDQQNPSAIGLSDHLTGQAALDQVLRPTSVPGLDIIPAGNQAPDPAELLGSRAMQGLVATLRDKYDFVLIDAPPVLPVADSLMLSRVVDSVVLVVRSAVTERKYAQEARRRLLAIHARILGVVLNDVDLATSPRERQMYGSYGTAS